jgi:hypothetical protein
LYTFTVNLCNGGLTSVRLTLLSSISQSLVSNKIPSSTQSSSKASASPPSAPSSCKCPWAPHRSSSSS